MAGVMPASGLRSPSGTGRGRTGPDHRIVVASPGAAGRISHLEAMGANIGGAGGSSARAPRSSVPIAARSSSGPPTMHGVRVSHPSRFRPGVGGDERRAPPAGGGFAAGGGAGAFLEVPYGARGGAPVAGAEVGARRQGPGQARGGEAGEVGGDVGGRS